MEIMNYDDVTSLLGVKKRTIQKWVAAGEFPKPIRLSTKCVVFDKNDINGWLYEKKEVQKSQAEG